MSDGDIIKCSSMVKRAQGKSSFGATNFRKRFFVLTPLKLSYYDGNLEKHDKLKGEIELNSVRAVETVADNAFGSPAFQVIHGEQPKQLTLYVLAQDANQQAEWVDALRELCRTNVGLLDNYHPQPVNKGKYPCCGASRSDLGCETSYFKTARTRAAYQSQGGNQYNSGSGSGAITYKDNISYGQQLRHQHKVGQSPVVSTPSYGYGSSNPYNGPGQPRPSPVRYQSQPPVVQPKPVEPAHEDFEVIAMYDYTPSDTVDLPLTKGQVVRIINSVRPHWWKARNNKGQEGYVPSNYVKKVGVETEDWFFPDLTRTRAEQILKEEGKEGGFVIRPSGKQNSNYKYALSICHESQVRHYHIKQDDRDNYYISDKHRFVSVVELVHYHKSNGGGLVTRLRRPPAQLVPNQPTLSSMFDDKWEIDKRDLHLGKELGSGQFGRVVKGVWKGTVEVAIKMMKERAMNEEDFIEEAQVMIKFHHPNLVQLYGICTCQGPIYIVTELMVNGCLLTYIRQRKDLTSKSDILIDMSLQICSAMKYLEASHFIHRDLAARNCLVAKINVVKVGDFGLARHVVDDEYTASEGTKFPIKWAAPEVISHARFSSKSDVWSYGILMWELFSGGKTPYPSFSNPQVFEEVLKGFRLPIPSNCPKKVYNLMREAWQQHPEERPSFNVLHMKLTQVVDHDYFEADIDY